LERLKHKDKNTSSNCIKPGQHTNGQIEVTCTPKNIPSLANISVQTRLENNYMDVIIRKYCIRSLVDSGSSICCVKQFFLHKIFPNPQPLQKSEFPVVKGISGKLIPVKGSIMLDINIGNAKFTQKFHVFDDIHHDLIIGIDFLTKE
jgi:hypothetical protein